MLVAVQFGLGTALASGNISFTTGFYRPEADVRCKMLKGGLRPGCRLSRFRRDGLASTKGDLCLSIVIACKRSLIYKIPEAGMLHFRSLDPANLNAKADQLQPYTLWGSRRIEKACITCMFTCSKKCMSGYHFFTSTIKTFQMQLPCYWHKSQRIGSSQMIEGEKPPGLTVGFRSK